MRVEGTARLPRLEVFQLFDPAGGIRLEIAMEARFGNATQPRDVARGDPLTAQVEGFHAHLDARIGMMKTPMLQRCNVGFAKRDLDHGRAPHGRVAINLAIATVT